MQFLTFPIFPVSSLNCATCCWAVFWFPPRIAVGWLGSDSAAPVASSLAARKEQKACNWFPLLISIRVHSVVSCVAKLKRIAESLQGKILQHLPALLCSSWRAQWSLNCIHVELCAEVLHWRVVGMQVHVLFAICCAKMPVILYKCLCAGDLPRRKFPQFLQLKPTAWGYFDHQAEWWHPNPKWLKTIGFHISPTFNSVWGWGLKNSWRGPLFFKYFQQFKENNGQALMLYSSYNVPGRVLAQGPT